MTTPRSPGTANDPPGGCGRALLGAARRGGPSGCFSPVQREQTTDAVATSSSNSAIDAAPETE